MRAFETLVAGVLVIAVISAWIHPWGNKKVTLRRKK